MSMMNDITCDSGKVQFKVLQPTITIPKIVVAFKQLESEDTIICLIKDKHQIIQLDHLEDIPAQNIIKFNDKGEQVWKAQSLGDVYGITYQARRFVDMLWEGDDTILVDNEGQRYLLNEDDGSFVKEEL
ncbi:hypothetical protein CO045_01245 [Candidatus Peregrinibacteria bacterium CG_4_9_14_0_2_um_filter_41_14]|nr:MAG: hypothetical protein COY06_01970 [Candidatus Peregrinibacteria bacterium CG_4_10_14_0_2_um_filter_41_8]PJC38251.1 MAG: hypothetical protein CO045_01245 [Candidatus Peregrinibacteria bacterium CG_4_9_14_0_2_um_filter_41_14]